MLERGRGWYPSRLKVGSHERFVIIAAGVNEKEKESLSATLGNINFAKKGLRTKRRTGSDPVAVRTI